MEEVYEEFNSYSKSAVRPAIKRLFDQGKLDRIDEGIYGIKDEKNILGRSSVSISDVIKKKYIEKDFYKVDFIDITDKFIYESCNYDEAINSLNEIIQLNILLEEIN